MGSDKGLLPIRNTIWAKHMHEKLAPFHIPVVYSINPDQLINYREQISPEYLVVDNTEVKGPLNGLLSIQQLYPGLDILLISCDMLDLDAATIENLLEQYNKDRTFDFYVYQDDECTQTFCGIYTGVGLEKVEGRLTIGRLENYSLQSILDEGYTMRLPVANKLVFRNYNSAAVIEKNFVEHG
jgi:molybdopterin-guanine dinucleotide biosynthesis protein A